MIYLRKGDKATDGTFTILDEDRLCFSVLSQNRGATGVRTISKALLEEFIEWEEQHPWGAASSARDDLSGLTDVDKYEYGYNSTLLAMAKLNKVVAKNRPAATSAQVVSCLNYPLQQIFYGAPGTGKSHAINAITMGKEVIRTTFHPDSDYATFVGAYKPTMGDDKIVYAFVAQAFLQAYIKAWKNYVDYAFNVKESPEPVFLVIEEINRGNCAQIFGDLFQLLDRNDAGFSDYPIVADSDMQKQLKKAFAKQVNPGEQIYLDGQYKEAVNAMYNGRDISTEVLNGEVLVLPSNLYIWATMNTSDQSLFPIDSAFKRRWDWKYIPINTSKENWSIQVNGKSYSWTSFLDKMNSEIEETTSSEDKKLGFYFCKAQNGVISAERFVSKVLFYLYNDVFKDYGFDKEFFKDANNSNKMISFQSFYRPDGSINDSQVALILDNLKVESFVDESAESDDDDDEDDENLDLTEPLNVVLDGKKIEGRRATDVYVNTLQAIGIERICNECQDLRAGDYPYPPVMKQKGMDTHYQDFGEYSVPTGLRGNKKEVMLRQIAERLKLDLKVNETAMNQKLRKFWSGLNEARNSNPAYAALYGPKTPSGGATMDLAFGTSAYWPYMKAVISQSFLKCGIWIGNSARKEEVFEAFKQHEEGIREIIGSSMNMGQAKKAYFLYGRKDMDLTNEENWPEAYQWLMNMALKMKEIKDKFGI